MALLRKATCDLRHPMNHRHPVARNFFVKIKKTFFSRIDTRRGELATQKATAVCCSVLQCAAVCCSVLQCVAVCYSVLQCVAVCCSVLQCVTVYHLKRWRILWVLATLYWVPSFHVLGDVRDGDVRDLWIEMFVEIFVTYELSWFFCDVRNM